MSFTFPLLRWPLWFAIWTVVGLSFAGQFYLASAQAGIAVTWRQALSGALGDWYTFAVLSAAVALLARQFPIARDHWGRNFLLHILAGVAFSATFMMLRACLAQWQNWAAGRPIDYAEALRILAVRTWHFNLLIYWAIVVLLHAVAFYRESQDRTARALALEKRLAEARLMALQMQLNPHFLFNALNGIATLMHRDVDTADRMLVRLAELLRLTLEKTGEQQTPLKDELALLERYLEIERLRFGNRLVTEFTVDPEAQMALVPTLVLQPLVENAIKHGLATKSEQGRIEISAAREGATLKIEIADNGRGITEKNGEAGVGLANTRARLEQLYGEKQMLELVNRPGGGAAVRIQLPFSRAGAPT